jgi:hypothetical protein
MPSSAHVSIFLTAKHRTKKERREEFRKTGTVDEKVHFYDVATSTLTVRPIGVVYGVKNLYKDASNLKDAHDLESKLSILEGEVSRTIQQMHQALVNGHISIKRKDLNVVRRFLFIMHYRQHSLSNSYFDVEKSGADKDWIEASRKKYGLHSAADQWLYVLRYYLETPHTTIVEHGLDLCKRLNLTAPSELLFMRFDPNEEHYPALAYQGLADNFFTCFWEAANGEEFILTSQSFGLWEGLFTSFPGVHHLFVLSPKLVLVLACHYLNPRVVSLMPNHKQITSCIQSKLKGVPHASPIPKHRAGGPAEPTQTELERYTSSAAAQDDTFDFTITKLTVRQTHEINHILLANVRYTGSITFVSREKTLGVVRTYCSDPIQMNPNRRLFVPFINVLSSDGASEDISTRGDLVVHVPLFLSLIDILSGTAQYRSVYDMVRALLRLVREPPLTQFSRDVVLLSIQAVMRCREVLKPPPPDLRSQPNASLVETLSAFQSTILLGALERLFDILGIVYRDELKLVTCQLAMVKLLEWMLLERPDVFDLIFEPLMPNLRR